LLKAYTAVGGVLARNGREAEVEALIAEMRSLGVVPDTHFFNSLIRGYGNKGLIHLASQVLFQMDRHGVDPDVATYERVCIRTPFFELMRFQ
jgi:pentatricopeptide repeat protein